MPTHRVALKIAKQIRPATPWNVALAALVRLEHAVIAEDTKSMEARWLFGRELLQHRVDYKGRQVVAADLMKLAMEKCGLSKQEINYRIQFAEKYSSKKLMSNAVGCYPSWHRMTREGLVDKPRQKSAKPTTTPTRVLRRLKSELATAFDHHPDLTRTYIKELETLVEQIQALLTQIDRNDATRAS